MLADCSDTQLLLPLFEPALGKGIAASPGTHYQHFPQTKCTAAAVNVFQRRLRIVIFQGKT